mgnify:CR=1 FL=1
MDGETIAVDDRVQIPLSELEFRFSRSSGPGGQHVQKSSTRVELLFDVARSPSLDDEQRARVLSRLSGYVDSDGVLHVVSQSERSQWRNRQEVVERFQELMRRALAPGGAIVDADHPGPLGAGHPGPAIAPDIHAEPDAAAIAGDTRWVRPLKPCRPSKLRFEVDAARWPGLSRSGSVSYTHLTLPTIYSV